MIESNRIKALEARIKEMKGLLLEFCTAQEMRDPNGARMARLRAKALLKQFTRWDEQYPEDSVWLKEGDQ